MSKPDSDIRVANIVADHDDPLTQWVNFGPIFFWYELLPTASGPWKFSKIRGLKITYFHFPSTKNIPNIENMRQFFCNYHSLIIKLKIYVNFQKNISPKMGLKLCSLIYKSIFAYEYYQSFIIHWLDVWKDEKNCF